MKLEFKVSEIDSNCIFMKNVFKDNEPREFIIVGESKINNLKCYKMIELKSEGIELIDGLDIEEVSYIVPEKDVRLIENQTTVLNIPLVYLSERIIENIQRLNA